MYTEWLAVEHNRMHQMEEWPDGPRKDAGLAAAKATYARLLQDAPADAAQFTCVLCASRHASTLTLVEYPHKLSVIEMPKKAA